MLVPRCLHYYILLAAAVLLPACRYSFKYRALAEEALTHCSWPGSGSGCYQRLEFLGDAVLDVLVTRHFFTSFRQEISKE